MIYNINPTVDSLGNLLQNSQQRTSLKYNVVYQTVNKRLRKTKMTRNVFKYIFCRCTLFGYLYTFLNFQIEPEFSAGIDPGMAFTPFPSRLLDGTRFKPTTLQIVSPIY
jgi:hypothetical protein